MSVDITGRYEEIMGHRLYMDAAGAETGKPMVLIHTAGQQALQWRFVLPYFAERGYFVLAPDLPGHGKSLLAGFKPLESVHGFAEVIWQLMERLGLKNSVVVGCSIGGDITLDLCAHHGSEMSAAIVCQAAAHTPTFPARMIERGMEDSGAPSYSDQGYLSGLSASGSKADKERGAEIAWTRRSGDPKIYYSDLKAWINHDIRPQLNKILCPVLCVWGNEDYFVPYDLIEETVSGIANARLEILDGIGHYPHMETPAFNPLVERFLSSLVPVREAE